MSRTYPLTGVRVLEFEGIGPGPLGACMLADFGADVVTLSRSDGKGRVRSKNDPVSRGKRSIAMNLKDPRAVALVKRIVREVDVLIEPFRPGVMERLGLGPDVLTSMNPKLIYARMTGWGQSGDPDYVKAAGHDANYLALSGTLSLFRKANDLTPSPPANFAGDYAGGATMLAMGVLLAYIERQTSGKGQVIDVAMVDGANYISLPVFKWLQMGTILREKDERGHLDSELSALHQAPHWCGVYECEDKEWISVQAIEPAFYRELLKGLELDIKTLPRQGDFESWPWMRKRFECIFRTKTRDEWEQVFRGTNACVAPVLTPKEAALHPHMSKRESFGVTPGSNGTLFEPNPAPKLSRTPGHTPRPGPRVPGEHTRVVLQKWGNLNGTEIESLIRDCVVASSDTRSRM
jgi:alpha-methylacyl-CoA racemase